jgi:general secretion pathway protein D
MMTNFENKPVRAAASQGICTHAALRIILVLSPLAVGGCAVKEIIVPTEGSLIPAPILEKPVFQQDSSKPSSAVDVKAGKAIQVSEAPLVPTTGKTSTIKAPNSKIPLGEAADTGLAFDQLPLPNFIQVVFGQVLKKNFSMDPALIARTDLVTIRTPTPSTKTQVLDVTRMLLKSYGVSVQEMGGFFRIGPDTNQSAYLPEIRRGRAQPEVPLPLRPVFSLVEMTSVRHTDVSKWLSAMFANRIKIQEDQARNALLLSGEPAELTAALEAVQILDQPVMSGRASQLISPASLSAEDLSKRLNDILSSEGYAVGAASAGTTGAISLVVIPTSNSLLVFAVDPSVLAHVREWAQKLDSMDHNNRRASNYFSYEVRYADAQSVAKTMQELLTLQNTATQESQQFAPGTRVIGATVNKQTGGRIVVNAATNTLIIYTSNADDQAQLLGVLKSIDRPAKSALIEVTVAEVRTGDKQDLGIEWGTGPRSLGDGTVSGGTLGGSVIANSSGLNLSFLNSAGVVRAKLNALASDSRARILSSPRIMARNGESATIQVGEEVPIITSQQTSATTAPIGGAPAILQQIQYKNTGVQLKVKPIIYAGNRVEIDVQQEVSSAGETKTGVNNTPTFSTILNQEN